MGELGLPHNERKQPQSPLYPLIETPREFFKELASSIQQAQKSIALAFFTFEKDSVTQPIFSALQEAAARGVDIRIALDHRGITPWASLRTRRALTEIKKAGKDHVHIHSGFQNRQRGSSLNPLLRLHKKIAVIDAQEKKPVAFIGGINISGRHADWGDLMIELKKKEAVTFIAEDFDLGWSGKNGKFHSRQIDAETSIYTVGKGGKELVHHTVDAIQNAQSRIAMETGYMDNGVIRQALIDAKKRGITVDILLPHPHTSNDIAYRVLPRRTIGPLEKARVDVSIFSGENPRYNHTKLLLVDDTAFVGSFNFTTSGLNGNNEEILFQTRNAQFVKDVEERFKKDKLTASTYEQLRSNQPYLRRKRW